jgi:hypothetical protein
MGTGEFAPDEDPWARHGGEFTEEAGLRQRLGRDCHKTTGLAEDGRKTAMMGRDDAGRAREMGVAARPGAIG